MTVTRKPPVGNLKKMALRGDCYQEEEDRYCPDTSTRSSPSVRRRSYQEEDVEGLSQDDLASSARSSPGGSRSLGEEVEQFGVASGSHGGRSRHGSGDEDWIMVDPKTDREFMNTIRRRILQCVSTNSEEEEGSVSEEPGETRDLMMNVMDGDEDWEEREKRKLRASMSSLTDIHDNGWEMKEMMKTIPRHDGFKSSDDVEKVAENHLDEHGTNFEEEEKESDDSPRRQLLTNFIQKSPLFKQDGHRQELMHIVKSYIKKVKKDRIMDILDTFLSEEEDNAEDAIFLISEVLYGK